MNRGFYDILLRLPNVGMRAAVSVCVILVAGACNLHFDVASVELRDGGTAGDGATTPIDGSASDGGDSPGDSMNGGTDGRDSLADSDGFTGDTDSEVGTVRECPVDVGSIQGCDPQKSNDCDESQTCTPRSINDKTVCVDDENFGSYELDEDCTVGAENRQCQRTLHCVDWDHSNAPDPRSVVCSKVCVVQTGWGCGTGDFCTNPFGNERLTGIGFCTRKCDPYKPDPCGGNADCGLDPNFLAKATCKPNFRCLSTIGSPNAAVGDTCDLTQLPDKGCGDELVCAPLPMKGDDNSDYCVRPCESKSDCSGDKECIESDNPWGLNYCDFSVN